MSVSTTAYAAHTMYEVHYCGSMANNCIKNRVKGKNERFCKDGISVKNAVTIARRVVKDESTTTTDYGDNWIVEMIYGYNTSRFLRPFFRAAGLRDEERFEVQAIFYTLFSLFYFFFFCTRISTQFHIKLGKCVV